MRTPNQVKIVECRTKNSCRTSFSPGRDSVVRCPDAAARRPYHAILFFCLLTSAFCPRAWGQYSIDWSTIDGGGGTSTGSVYSVSGTIGQHDASGPMTGGNYTVTGGFWSLLAAVQTPGVPPLTITHSGNSVVVFWPVSPGGFTLQQNGNLANPAGWSTYGGTVSTNNGVNSITITPPVGNLFFRLYHP